MAGFGPPFSISQNATNKMDILFMVDNSTSMDAMQTELRTRFPSFVQPFVDLAKSGKLWAALAESLKPFVVGYGLAILIGVPLGLVIGRFRVMEAALGIYVTAGYAMPLVALVPLLVLWLGLGFAVKAAIVFLSA